MEYSVREAKANFAHALSLAASGEKVVITKHGKPFAEIIPATVVPAEDFWLKAERVSAELGLDAVDGDESTAEWFARFNDPALIREIFGVDT